MVDTQLIRRGIGDGRVIQAMRTVARHRFVSQDLVHRAYDDMALQIGEGQTISQPYMVAIMTELLELRGDERVLEIGTGSGYQTAVLAELAREVFTVEYHTGLLAGAEERLHSLGYVNISFKAGDGTLGWPEAAPFNRILITAAAPRIPEPLESQVSERGIIVAPVGSRWSQELIKATKIDDKFRDEYSTPCVFVPLMGRYGWSEE